MKIRLSIKIKGKETKKNEEEDRMYAYVHIELVTSSGKCPFFFLSFTCVKANLKVMILLITVRDHLA
jgi:hypothetical protein